MLSAENSREAFGAIAALQQERLARAPPPSGVVCEAARLAGKDQRRILGDSCASTACSARLIRIVGHLHPRLVAPVRFLPIGHRLVLRS